MIIMFDKKKYAHDYYLKNKEKIKQRARDWEMSHREYCNKRKNKDAKKHGYKYQKEYHQKRRLKVLTHYGGNPPRCACKGCNEMNVGFLTLDHYTINPDKHHRSGDSLYSWIIKNNFPEGFRVLCFNCNHYVGHHNGHCLHEDMIEKPKGF